MQQLLTRKPTDANKLTYRPLLREPFSQNPPTYADNQFTIPQIRELQQRFQP